MDRFLSKCAICSVALCILTVSMAVRCNVAKASPEPSPPRECYLIQYDIDSTNQLIAQKTAIRATHVSSRDAALASQASNTALANYWYPINSYFGSYYATLALANAADVAFWNSAIADDDYWLGQYNTMLNEYTLEFNNADC